LKCADPPPNNQSALSVHTESFWLTMVINIALLIGTFKFPLTHCRDYWFLATFGD
jgi:hypothetical protein